MFWVYHLLARALELALAIPLRLCQFVLAAIIFNTRLGPLRYLLTAVIGFVAFAFALVYVMAPIRGMVGHYWMGEKLRYDAERWLATAIYDARGNFVGTFDPRLDSKRDVNWTGKPIDIGDYTAFPDHKSIPVRDVPEAYWACLKYHEDRYIGGWLNPFGIDLTGVLKIPYSTLQRSLAARRPRLGVGGSTLPMQFARVIYNSPPDASEGGFTKLGRKLKEWWLAPVIYAELTRGGDDTPLKEWAANHIWLAQRTGGAPLHGVEVTARVVFGKEAKDLTTAEQYVLASAVNKPIILLQGDEKLNKVREDRWRYITGVRAKKCADVLISDAAERQQATFELLTMAGGPPDPQVKPKLQQALEQFSPLFAKRAEANPVLRANILAPDGRLGVREEMKQEYGFGWREVVRGVTLTFDVTENRAYRDKVRTALTRINARYAGKIDPGFTLDLDQAGAQSGKRMPHVVIAAANPKGELVRYFESSENAPYFGSAIARDTISGHYEAAREVRAIASTAKMLAAVAVANEGRDGADTPYVDVEAPAGSLDTCEHHGKERRGRRALVSFACSLNKPLEWRMAQLGQGPVKTIINRFGLTLPPTPHGIEPTPPSTALVLGLVTASPRKVHQVAGVVLASLVGQGLAAKPVKLPTLVRKYDFTKREYEDVTTPDSAEDLIPDKLIHRDARGLVKSLLEAPLCYQHQGVAYGTLKALSNWCAARRPDLRLHFAKTGTMVTEDPNATVDAWIAGGLQFANGAAYSYVVLVGTGNTREPWARDLHAAQVAMPLLETLLTELSDMARKEPQPALLPPQPVAASRFEPAAAGASTSIAKAGPARDAVFTK